MTKKKTPNNKKPAVKTPKAKKKVRYEVLELPSNNVAMAKFVEENRLDISKKIVDAVEHALQHRLTGIEMFCFKDSSFVVILNRRDFVESLEDVFEFAMTNQHYELCARVNQLMDRVKKLSYVFTYNKTNKHVQEKKNNKQKDSND